MNNARDIFENIYAEPGAVWTSSGPPPGLVSLIDEQVVMPGRAVDVGCGEGYYSIYLASKGFEVTGIDFSSRAIQYATENAKNAGVDIRFLTMDIAGLDKLEERFDFVLEWGVMHHVFPPHRDEYIKQISEMLNGGGKYLSYSFNDQSLEFGGVGNKYRETPLGTTMYFSSLDELVELLQPYFRVIRSEVAGVPLGNGRDMVRNYLLGEKV